MKRIYRVFTFFIVFMLTIGLFSPTYLVKAEDSWNNDVALWQSYGNQGWTDTGSDVPKWSGSVANKAGDPSTDPLAYPQPLPIEEVHYFQMNKMPDGKCLAEPNEAVEDVTYYAVYSPEQFRYAMNNQYNIKLMNDLDMNQKAWSAATLNRKVFIDGNNHTIYNLKGGALVTTWTQPLIVSDLMVSSAQINEGIFGSSMSDTYISLENVSVEHAIVDGTGHMGALVSHAYYRNSGSFARVYANHCHSKNVYVRSTSCSGNIFGPISGWIENCYAIDGSMRTVSHSGAFTSCAGNYVIQNCFTNVRAYATAGVGNTGAFVGHVEDSYYTPGGGRVTKFINCYASGSVEGTDNLGGFVAGAGNCENVAECQFLFENCYSTAMVGMIANRNYQGGFIGCQEANASSTFRNCYAAGEVGALGTNLDDKGQLMGGFVGGKSGGRLYLENCYYDKQTTAMKEKSGFENANNMTDSEGLLTQELMKTLPDGKVPEDSAWVLTDGTYPQLKMFAQNKTYNPQDIDTADAYSKASVCTALLYPSNLSEEQFASADKTDYDTVRSLRFLFPLTNNVLANTANEYDISWESDGTKCEVEGMTNADIVSIRPVDEKNPSEDFSIQSLAPGVGMVTVSVDKNGTIGQRRLRLVPTSAITITQDESSDVTSGLDAMIYAVPKGEDITESKGVNYLTFKEVTYDHRIGMFFASGNSMGQNVKKQGLEGVVQENVNQFKRVDFTADPGGSVSTIVHKKMDDGTLKELTVTDELIQLFTGKKAAQSSDIGEYYFTYRWYLRSDDFGKDYGYLETRKKLTVSPAVTPVFYRNYDANDSTKVELPKDSVPANQKALYYKNGDKLSTLPLDPTRDGYTFKGWTLKKTRAVELINSDTVIDTDWANSQYIIPIYAVWEANPHKIHIEGIPGVEDIDVDSAVDQNITDSLKDYEPDLKDKVFIGWSTDPNGNVVDIDDDKLLGDEDITVYPIWLAKPTLSKEVVNLTNSATTQVGDVLQYTITVSNTEENSTWKDVKINDTLPQGLSYYPGSLQLVDSEGNVTSLPDSVYDKTTHSIKYTIENINGGKAYALIFKTTVSANAIQAGKDSLSDISNTVLVTGKNPDGTENLPVDPNNPKQPGQSTAVPEGGEEVTPLNPNGDIQKYAKNITHTEGQTFVDDHIIYTIKVINQVPGSIWKDVSIGDVLPVGLEVKTDSITLSLPNGEKLALQDVYDSQSRQIGVYIGDVYGSEVYTLTYEVVVTPEAVHKDIGNSAFALGHNPDEETDIDLEVGDANYIDEEDIADSSISMKIEEPVYPFEKDKLNPDGTGGVGVIDTPYVDTSDQIQLLEYSLLLVVSLCGFVMSRKRFLRS